MASVPVIPPSRGPVRIPPRVLWLQGVTIAWMVVECGFSLYGAVSAKSAVLLAFGSDSLVELLSAAVVLLAVIPSFPLSSRRAARFNGILLLALAGMIALVSMLALEFRIRPETSCAGIAITAAALFVMPLLAWAKRRTAQETGNRAMAADAIQSGTCAYLALISLAGLGLNALWHLPWVDSVAAFLALPILIVEGRRALQGESCSCC
ncbi:MAG TPA: cation transporter [Acidobacteriaceae bacterium]|nr:cation transporter [Acidobacteriaceae bacterium]